MSLEDSLPEVDLQKIASRAVDWGLVCVPQERGEWVFVAVQEDAFAALRAFHAHAEEFGGSCLVDLTAIDGAPAETPGAAAQLELRYVLQFLQRPKTIEVRIELSQEEGGAPVADTVVPLWPAADWLERELFDLFGISFRGHPDLRRIMRAPDSFGAPLLKAEPLLSGSATFEGAPLSKGALLSKGVTPNDGVTSWESGT